MLTTPAASERPQQKPADIYNSNEFWQRTATPPEAQAGSAAAEGRTKAPETETCILRHLQLQFGYSVLGAAN